MKQWVLFMSIFLTLLSLNNNLFAHAVVMDHTLKSIQIHANEAKKIELTFNSKVEIGLSQIFLVSKGDKHTLLTISKGEGQGNVSVAIPALTVGEYALRYKIFAADGHLTEDVIHFSVTP